MGKTELQYSLIAWRLLADCETLVCVRDKEKWKARFVKYLIENELDSTLLDKIKFSESEEITEERYAKIVDCKVSKMITEDNVWKQEYECEFIGEEESDV